MVQGTDGREMVAGISLLQLPGICRRERKLAVGTWNLESTPIAHAT